MINRLIRAAPAFCLFPPSLAHAHAGGGAASGFISGLAHLVVGPDHLLVMRRITMPQITHAAGVFMAAFGGYLVLVQ